MPDRWDAEAREALCCCDVSRERSHALYCPADNSALVACVVALARRAYREGLERAAEIAWPWGDRAPSPSTRECTVANAERREVSAAIRREIERT